jgi:hypothetical protein
MKRNVKKLTLTKESIRLLDRSSLGGVAGQAPPPTNHEETCITCHSCFRTCTC